MDNDKEFIRAVLLFADDEGGPESYSRWDEERCKRLMPAFYKSYQDLLIAKEVLDRVIKSYYQKYASA